MWNLQAIYLDVKKNERELVTIIDFFFEPDEKIVYFIAVDKDGEFFKAQMEYFTLKQ